MAKEKEVKFDPKEELRSFTQQLTGMRKSVKETISQMKKEIGTELIDTNQLKKQFKELENFVNSESMKFGTKMSSVFEIITKNFVSSNESLMKTMQGDNIYKVLARQGTEAIKVFDDLSTQLGTLDFPEAYKDSMESINKIRDANAEIIEQGKKDGVLKNESLIISNRINDALEISIKNKQKEFEKAIAINDQLIAAKEAIGDFTDSAFSFFNKIPGGKYFQTALGLDKIKEDIMKNVGTALSQSINKGVNAIPAFNIAIKGVVGTYLKFARMLLLNPWTVAIAGMVLLIKLFVDLEKAGEDFRETTGLTLTQTKKLTPQIESAALSMRKYGISVEDTYDSAAELFDTFKNISLITPALVKNVAMLEANLGISRKTGAQVAKLFLSMKGVSKDNLNAWEGSVIALAKAGGVAPSAVFEDMAQNAELISTYFSGNVDQVIRTTVAVRRLGLELSDVGDIISSAIDFESSIEKELEASVLLGRQIDFNAARQMIFENNIEGATKEVLRQVGTLADFDRMNFIQRKAIADASGLSVNKLRESLVTQDMLSNATESQKKRYEEINDQIEKGNVKSFEQVILQKEMHGTISKLKDSFMAIGASLAKVILPVINAMRPAVETIASVVGSIATAFSSIGDFINKIVPGGKEFTAQIAGWPILLLLATKPLTGMVGIFKSLIGMSKSAILGITKTIGGVGKLGKGKILSATKTIGGVGKVGKVGKGAISGVTKTVGRVGGIGKSLNPVAMLKAAASILIISGALFVFAKALQEIDKVKDITKALIGATIGLVVLSVVAMALGSASPAMLLGALTIGVLAGALWVLGAAINQFVPMVDILLEGLGVIIEVVGDAIVKVITAVADSFIKLSGLGTGLATTAIAIYALTGALAAFIAISAAGSFASMFSGIGDSPVDQLERLAAIGPGLMLTANALKQFTGTPEVSTAKIGETIEISANVGKISEVIMESNNKTNEKLDEVILAVKNINVYLDGRKVNENIARNSSVSNLT